MSTSSALISTAGPAVIGPIPARRRLGTAGEGHARRYLEAAGLLFIAAQWRGAGCEVDLIMRDGNELVFVEVKTRRGDASGRAEEAVSTRQVRALARAAEAFVIELDEPGVDEPVWRMDLVALTLDRSGRVAELTHIENAFVLDG